MNTSTPEFTDRISLLEFVSQRSPEIEVMEVGAASGCFTKQILASIPNLKVVHALDCWLYQPDGYHDACNLSQEEQTERYEQFQKDFGSNPKVRIVRGMSPGIAGSFQNEQFDFIYIDANHSYAAVLEDLKAWFPKLKLGGVIAGHDFQDGETPGNGVKRAVYEFFNPDRVMVTTCEFCRDSGVYGPGWEGFSFVVIK